MLITVERLSRSFGIRPRGVLHVGAHEAEEAADYAKFGWGPVIWVEMLPDKFEALRQRFAGDPGNTVLNAACWDTDGDVLPIFRANNGQSSSLLRPDQHLSSHPRITFAQDTQTRTSRLETILPAGAPIEYLSLDIQGAELRALKGLGSRLATVKWACIEVNTRRLYADCALVGELDVFLAQAGFARLLTRMAGTKGWGDAIYINTRLLSGEDQKRLRRKAMQWKVAHAVADLPQNLRPRALLQRARGLA